MCRRVFGVRLLMLIVCFLVGCSTIRAPELKPVVWVGESRPMLRAELKVRSPSLEDGWLASSPSVGADGSVAYRKRSDSYDYAESGYFVVHPKWQAGVRYFGFVKDGKTFCVANPEQQSDSTDTTVTYMTVYDFCVQLHSQ